MSPLWGSVDQANNAPKWNILGGLHASANGNVAFQNTTTSAFVTNLAVGDFGVSAAETLITTGEGGKVAHSGWNLRKAGVGPINTITVANGGTNYNTNGFIVFSGTGTGANASYNVNTTSNTITTVTLINGGSGYVSTPKANVANGTGANVATFNITMGGRANRVHYECLVAQGSMNSSGNAIFPVS